MGNEYTTAHEHAIVSIDTTAQRANYCCALPSVDSYILGALPEYIRERADFSPYRVESKVQFSSLSEPVLRTQVIEPRKLSGFEAH